MDVAGLTTMAGFEVLTRLDSVIIGTDTTDKAMTFPPGFPATAGLYRSNSVVTHKLESAWFQPFSLSSENPVSPNFALKFNLYRYTTLTATSALRSVAIKNVAMGSGTYADAVIASFASTGSVKDFQCKACSLTAIPSALADFGARLTGLSLPGNAGITVGRYKLRMQLTHR